MLRIIVAKFLNLLSLGFSNEEFVAKSFYPIIAKLNQFVYIRRRI